MIETMHILVPGKKFLKFLSPLLGPSPQQARVFLGCVVLALSKRGPMGIRFPLFLLCAVVDFGGQCEIRCVVRRGYEGAFHRLCLESGFISGFLVIKLSRPGVRVL